MASKEKRENGSAMDDTEFEKLLDEMDELGRQADALREKVNHLIDEMRENDVVQDEDGGEDGVAGDGDAEHATSEESVDEEADRATLGEAVDQGANDIAMDEEADGEST